MRLSHVSYLLLHSEMAMPMLVKTASRLRPPKRWVGHHSARRWGPLHARRNVVGIQKDEDTSHVQSPRPSFSVPHFEPQPYHDMDKFVQHTKDLDGNRFEVKHLRDQHDTIPNAMDGTQGLILPPSHLTKPGLRMLDYGKAD
jgi:hypothetical protein